MTGYTADSCRKMPKLHSSKGNQNKWVEDNWWYKEDALGHESLSEILISRLLKKSNLENYVLYEHVWIEKNGEQVNGCRSKNFLTEEDDRLISAERLFQLRKGKGAAAACAEIAGTADRIRFFVEQAEEMTGIADFGRYLRNLLTLDALFLNEDRHFHNIAVIQRMDGSFRAAPVFDNGAALFSDTLIEYPVSEPYENCLRKIKAKPFSTDFDEQLDAIEQLYPRQPFQAWFTIGDVQNILAELAGFYEPAAVRRIDETMRQQFRKYAYLFRE